VKPVFADCYYFFAFLSPRDNAHLSVMKFHSTARRRIVTMGWVLTEVGDGLATGSSRKLFAKPVIRVHADARDHGRADSRSPLRAGGIQRSFEACLMLKNSRPAVGARANPGRQKKI
jgi:hypothetical protein